MKHTVLLLAATLLSEIPVRAAEPDPRAQWPQWRGPELTGFAPLADPPVEWSEKKNLKWKVRIPGSGHASPIVWGDRVFVLTAVEPGIEGAAIAAGPPPGGDRPGGPAGPGPSGGDGRPPGPGGPGGPGGRGGRGGGGTVPPPTEPMPFQVLCLDRGTGRTVWQQTATNLIPHEGHHRDHGFASASPVTDGERLFAFFGSRGLYAYDLEGRLLWARDLGRMQTRNGFGEGTSPAVYGDTLVVNWDHEGDDFIVALDKRTGQERWRQSRSEATTWTTPLIVDHQGRPQVIVTASNRTRAYDLATGKELWECGGMTQNVIPTPVAAGGVVFAISGFRGAALQAIKLGRTGDLTGGDAIAWSHGKSTPYVPSPALIGDHLYFVSGNQGLLSCFDITTGKALFEAERLEDMRNVYASIVAARDRVYVTSREGRTVVLKDSGKPEVLASNALDEGIDASPALVGNQLFLRGRQHLYCFAAD